VLRLIFLGMSGVFSRLSLEKLLQMAEVEVQAVLIPAESSNGPASLRRIQPHRPAPTELPLLNPHLNPTIVHLAWAHNIPVWAVGSLAHVDILALWREVQPDLGIVVCFSQRVPPTLLQLPRYGCLNLHPSLLPAYRGPAPLFWLARQGETQAGVTLHFLAESLDSGDIVAQTRFAWPEGSSETALDHRCALAGADLLEAALAQLEQAGTLPRHPQPEQGVSYQPWPTQPDFCVPTTWSARRAFNFLRFGEQTWPLWVDTGSQQVFIRTVVAYEPTTILPQPVVAQGDELWLQFNPGVVKVIPKDVV
jgi:methionyl-tRNA formyltransferase